MLSIRAPFGLSSPFLILLYLEYRPDDNFEATWRGQRPVVPVKRVGVTRQKIGEWKLFQVHNGSLVFFLFQHFQN